MSRELSLRPYPGKVIVCKSRKEYMREHLKRFKREGPDLTTRKGRMDGRWTEGKGGVYLVWGESQSFLAHEFCHVLLHIFELIGTDPRREGEEPFCYMLSQLLLEAE